MTKTTDKIIEYGIIFLIIFTPLALGSIHYWAVSMMEFMALVMITIWTIARLISKFSATNDLCLSSSQNGREVGWAMPTKKAGLNGIKKISNHRILNSPLNLPIIIFVLLIIIQLIPLPPSVLKAVSPNTHQLYKQTLPGYDTSSKGLEFNDRNSDIKPNNYSSGFSTSNFKLQTSNYWKPLSLYPYATKLNLLKVLAYATIFFLIINTKTLKPQRLLMSIVISGFIVSLVAIIQYVCDTKKIYWIYNASYASPVGPFTYRGYFASYMTMVIPLAIGLLIYYLSYKINTVTELNKDKHTKYYHRRKSSLIWLTSTVFILIVIIMMSTILFLSLSRGGMVSNVLSLIFFVFFLTMRKTVRKNIIYLLPIILLMFVALGWVGINPVTDRLSTLYEIEEERTGLVRFAIWSDTGNIIKDFPVFGTGFGTFRYIYPKYRDEVLNYLAVYVFPVRAHNDYLEVASVMGVLGIVVVLWGCYRLFKDILFCHILGKTRGIAHVMPEADSLRRRNDKPKNLMRRNPFVLLMGFGCLASILAIVFHSFTDFVLHSPANAMLFFVILGLVCRIIHEK
ncbi:MAG: putative membrane protein [Candidatus Scalindua rubra]|uniref:Putative membrane protein n=1 Tax=Candidatus Scalindua rubra TaxID=1872076 RepID=A0A1E3XAY6_9BACT|nr:MAG: putative membrane protein [Candidatus Scalindua rubra]